MSQQPLDTTENLTHAFEQAFENEKRLVDTLTFIEHNAVAFEDYEVGYKPTVLVAMKLKNLYWFLHK